MVTLARQRLSASVLTRLRARWTRPAADATMAVVDEEVRELLTVSEVAARCHVSRQTVYNWLTEGRLHPVAKYRYAEQWALLFDPSDVAGMRDRRLKPHG